MSKRFSSFFLRYWSRANGEARIEIEYIQGETRTVVASTSAALRWIDQHATDEGVAALPGRAISPERSGLTGDDVTSRHSDEDDGQDVE